MCRKLLNVLPAGRPFHAIHTSQFSHHTRDSKAKDKDMDKEKRKKYARLFKQASTQVSKLGARGLSEAFGQLPDDKAPPLSLSKGGSVVALMPRKNSYLRLHASVHSYFTSIGSPGLTGCGTTSGGRAARTTRGATQREDDEAMELTLKRYGECALAQDTKELLRAEALKVSVVMSVVVCVG